MTDKTDYQPPRVWRWENESGGQFVSNERPSATDFVTRTQDKL